MWDIINKKIDLDVTHILYHCSQCKERNYSSKMKDCFSGGRYCAIPKSEMITADKILTQTLSNLCAKQIFADNHRNMLEYYYKYANSCAKYLTHDCVNSVLLSMTFTNPSLISSTGSLMEDMKDCMANSMVEIPGQ